jgi:hypothetical protein
MKFTEYPVDGKYGKYGGRFVPEILMEAIKELEEAYEKAKKDPAFHKQLDYYLLYLWTVFGGSIIEVKDKIAGIERSMQELAEIGKEELERRGLAPKTL